MFNVIIVSLLILILIGVAYICDAIPDLKEDVKKLSARLYSIESMLFKLQKKKD